MVAPLAENLAAESVEQTAVLLEYLLAAWRAGSMVDLTESMMVASSAERKADLTVA